MKIDFEFAGLDITADIHELIDPFGTGDSPTLYEVDILEIVGDEGQIEANSLSDTFYDSLIDEAIEAFKG